jgi:hypothetical protein
MVAGERELYQRFAVYDDEELLRILTAERAQYRREALAAAEMVLTQRGVAPPAAPYPDLPLWPPKIEPPPAQAQRPLTPKTPYQLIDLFFDVLLIGFVFWAMKKLESWALMSGEVWGGITYGVLFIALIRSASSLRERWRAKKWRD